jgi:hypothetical protein
MSFVPHFIQGVTVTIYNYDPITHTVTVIQSPVDPIYCLSNDANDPGGAEAFVKMFPQFKATITLDNPEGPGFFGSASAQAPFITWSADGMSTGPMNAGVLANIYNHGYPETYASTQVINAITSQLGY